MDMRSYRVWSLVAWVVVLAHPTFACADEAPDRTVRVALRAECKVPAGVRWEGLVKLDRGTITASRPAAIGGEVVAVAATAGEAKFSGNGPVSLCRLDLTVDAPMNATVEMQVDGHTVTTSLDRLLFGSPAVVEWDGWARIGRDPADILRVKPDRAHLIFSPGETAHVDVTFHYITSDAATVATQLQVELRPARQLAPLVTKQSELQIASNAASPPRRRLQLRMPELAGAYDLWVRATPSGLAPVERVVPCVVVDPRPKPAARAGELVTELIVELDPRSAAPGKPWYSKQRIWAGTTRLGHLLWTSVRHPFGASDATGDLFVRQLQLLVKRPGVAHLVRIEYEASRPIMLAASIAEADPDGRWVQTPLASGIGPSDQPAANKTETHQFFCWPHTTSPILWLYAEGAGSSAVKNVQLFELPDGLPPLAVREPDGRPRIFGLFVDGSDAWSQWGAARATDAATGLVSADWQTYLDGAERLAEYARYCGYNCLQVTAAGPDGVLYPTRLLAGSLDDTARFAGAAGDIPARDVVELLLRTCARDGLGLMPTLRWESALPALDERPASADSRCDGVMLVSREGKLWDRETTSGGRPRRRYNPLHPEVQAAVIEIVREFSARYAAHSAFRGLALDLAADSQLVLPDLDWGYDDFTVAQFRRETGADAVGLDDSGADRFALRHRVLTGEKRDAWAAWRCRRLSAFYETILAELQRTNPNARLMLNLSTLTSANPNELRDVLRQSRNVEDVLKSKGLDMRGWAAPADIIVARVFLTSGGSSEGAHWNTSRELDELLARLPRRGALSVYVPQSLPLATEAGSDRPAGNVASEAVRVALGEPGRCSRRYARSLAAGDCEVIFEGGAALSIGQEDTTRRFARVFRAIPSGTFRPLATPQPVIVRSHGTSRDAYAYLVNDASYPIEATLSFACPDRTRLVDATNGEPVSADGSAGRLDARLSLEPFETLVLRASNAEATVTECKPNVPATAEKGLKVRFDRLTQAMMVLRRDGGRTLEGLPPNGEFELAKDDTTAPAHWSSEGPSARGELDETNTRGGKRSLRLSGSAGDGVGSDAFEPPDSKAMAMNVALKADRPGLRVRWMLVGDNGGENVHRWSADVKLQTAWEQKQFRARDLPAQLANVRVRFQLLDEGTIWIDEARVCALPISKDEQASISKSVSAIFRAWKDQRLSDFERMAEGYWATYLIESVEGPLAPSAAAPLEDAAVRPTSGI